MAKLSFFKKLIQWEYWPSFMFYIPNLPYAFYLAFKMRNFTFYSAVNTGIKNSGNGTESKYRTLDLIPSHLKPKSLFVSQKRTFDKVLSEVEELGISYPLIVKPDIGFRGMLVKKISSPIKLKEYLNSYPLDIIIQEFIDLPKECGIFYYRLPNQENGTISSFTIKSFLTVKGDGVATLSQLVTQDERANHYKDQLQIEHLKNWNKIPDKGADILLSAIGNHSKGTQFINGNHLIDKELNNVLDGLSKKLKGWNYGRIDIKYKTLEDLKKGKNFIILEINGTISEPTHMYDPSKTTYLKALKTMRAHWKIIYQIAKENMDNGVKPSNFIPYWMEVKDLLMYINRVSKLSKLQSQLF